MKTFVIPLWIRAQNNTLLARNRRDVKTTFGKSYGDIRLQKTASTWKLGHILFVLSP